MNQIINEKLYYVSIAPDRVNGIDNIFILTECKLVAVNKNFIFYIKEKYFNKYKKPNNFFDKNERLNQEQIKMVSVIKRKRLNTLNSNNFNNIYGFNIYGLFDVEIDMKDILVEFNQLIRNQMELIGEIQKCYSKLKKSKLEI